MKVHKSQIIGCKRASETSLGVVSQSDTDPYEVGLRWSFLVCLIYITSSYAGYTA